jgi:hypothetical protein
MTGGKSKTFFKLHDFNIDLTISIIAKEMISKKSKNLRITLTH